jgi:PAS domain S-box-containing protein
LSLAAFYWMITFFLFTSAREYEEAIFWRKAFSLWPLTVVLQTYFVLVFTERKNILKNKFIYPILFIPTSLIIFWELNDLIVLDLTLKSWGWVETNSLSPFFVISSIFGIILGFSNLFLCIHYIYTSNTVEKKNQAIYVFLGMLVPVILGLSSQIFFQILEIHLPDMTVFGWGLGCCIIAIGILRSKLFILSPSSIADNILTSMVSGTDFSSITERSFDLIYAVDTEGVIKYVSPSVVDILGYSRNELTGKMFHHFIDPTTVSSVLESCSNLIGIDFHENAVETTKFKMRKKDGTFSTLLANSIPIVKDGSIYGLQGVAKDITNYDFIEKSRQSFVAMVSHELRTPIAVIRGYAEFLSRNHRDLESKKIDHSLEEIIQNANRLEKLIQNVVDVDKISRASFKINLQNVNISKLVNSTIEPFIQMLGDQIKLDNQIIEDKLEINCDPQRIQQVIENIIQNAVKHTSKNDRQIIIKISSENKYVKITITDNGAGILSENLEKIFNQFVSIPSKFSVTGSGIGLYISKKIINAHEGKLIAISNGEGLGSSFIIKLPRN